MKQMQELEPPVTETLSERSWRSERDARTCTACGKKEKNEALQLDQSFPRQLLLLFFSSSKVSELTGCADKSATAADRNPRESHFRCFPSYLEEFFVEYNFHRDLPTH